MSGRFLDSIGRALKFRRLRREKPQVWLLEDMRLAYIQIPKIATRSIRASIAAHLLTVEEGGFEWEHITPQRVKALEAGHSVHVSPRRIPALLAGYDSFAFVRNPLERLWSCYRDKVRDLPVTGKKNIFSVYGFAPGMSFAEFVQCVAEIPDVKADRHFRSQHWFLYSDNRPLVKRIGRLETFERDWARLAADYPLPVPPHRNRGQGGHESMATVYDPETLAIAMQRYAADIDLLGYRKEVAVFMKNLNARST